VRWADGEMTLYTGVDAKGFHGERQLAAPGSALWRDDARLMTGGRFTPGGNRDDLLVTFKDGHVSLYTDLATNGLTKPAQITPANAVWTHAGQLTAGSFTGGATDDAVVRWSDGETTLYTDLAANGLGKPTQITPANTVWTHAGQLTAGSFTGGATDDAVVRWSDGETTLYPALTASGVPPETQLRAPGSAWKDAAVVTAGAFADNVNADDVLVRWSDGRLSMFTGVDGKGLHAETNLN